MLKKKKSPFTIMGFRNCFLATEQEYIVVELSLNLLCLEMVTILFIFSSRWYSDFFLTLAFV